MCLGTTAQMIDFRIADLRALAFHRIAFLNYSFLEASNSLMISRARAWACTCKGTLSVLACFPQILVPRGVKFSNDFSRAGVGVYVQGDLKRVFLQIRCVLLVVVTSGDGADVLSSPVKTASV